MFNYTSKAMGNISSTELIIITVVLVVVIMFVLRVIKNIFADLNAVICGWLA